MAAHPRTSLLPQNKSAQNSRQASSNGSLSWADDCEQSRYPGDAKHSAA
ncbi:hypothetical protein [Kibdelosporangium philippinense]